jgi:hypothetical protein
LGVTTVTSTAPVPGGLVAVISVSESTIIITALTPPKSTAVAPVKPLPVIRTLLPPLVGPLAGEIAVTCGGAVSGGVGGGGVGVAGPDMP